MREIEAQDRGFHRDPGMTVGERNAWWAANLVAEFRAQGVERFFVAPGARCTPLTLAVARSGAERCGISTSGDWPSGAVGHARASGRPAWSCARRVRRWRSDPGGGGGAAGRGAADSVHGGPPARIARRGGEPSHRPSEMFGDQVAWFVDLPCPTDEARIGYVADHGGAGGGACVGRSGWCRSTACSAALLTRSVRWCGSRTPARGPGGAAARGTWRLHAEDWPERGWLLLGRGTPDVAVVRDLGERLGWPVYGDATAAVHDLSLELALGNENSGWPAAPKWWSSSGGPSCPRRWRDTWTNARRGGCGWRARPAARIRRHAAEELVVGDVRPRTGARAPGGLAGGMRGGAGGPGGGGRTGAGGSVRTVGGAGGGAALPDRAGPVLGNSLPVRLVDLLGVWNEDGPAGSGANRGASGIGRGCGERGRVRRRGRDHAAARRGSVPAPRSQQPGLGEGSGGGGAQQRRRRDLPSVADRGTAEFEPWFGTPHGMGFEHAARQFGLAYSAPKSLRNSWPSTAPPKAGP